MKIPALPVLALLPLMAVPAYACQCEIFATCNEVAATNLVFIGTVESIQPNFLNRWNTDSRDSLTALNEAFLAARQHPTDDALAKLKEAYLKTFPDASADRKKQVLSAKTPSAVASLFYAGVGRGMTIHLRVQTLFKHGSGDDDDDHKDDDARKPEAEQYFDVWTPFGDCGVAFQTGETYLVYASDDEEANVPISTDSCTRTRRLSDAGDDLAYLYFYKNHPDASTRVDGYLTSDRRFRLDFDPLHPERIKSPVGGLVVELQSDLLTRFVEAGANGHFLFDGLPAGDYKVSAYAHAYPSDPRRLAGPQAFHLQPKSCSLQVVVVPPEEVKPK